MAVLKRKLIVLLQGKGVLGLNPTRKGKRVLKKIEKDVLLVAELEHLVGVIGKDVHLVVELEHLVGVIEKDVRLVIR
jgi:hypothetical protein